jgi:hypothetical protein
VLTALALARVGKVDARYACLIAGFVSYSLLHVTCHNSVCAQLQMAITYSCDLWPAVGSLAVLPRQPAAAAALRSHEVADVLTALAVERQRKVDATCVLTVTSGFECCCIAVDSCHTCAVS